MTPSEQVQVDVRDSLSSIGQAVHYRSEAVDQALGPGYLYGGALQLSKKLRVGFGNVEKCRDVSLRNHQNMGRGLWLEISESDQAVVFEHDLCRDLF